MSEKILNHAVCHNGMAELPFSFSYNGIKSIKSASDWHHSTDEKQVDGSKISSISVYIDPKTQIRTTCETVEHSDFSAVEWVVKLRNDGEMDTPILENIFPLDIQLNRSDLKDEFLLHHALGSQASKSDFSPLENVLGSCCCKRLHSLGGRSSSAGRFPPYDDGSFPFFNLEFDGGGIIFAIGWSGSWFAELKRDDKSSLWIQAGMPNVRTKLFPKEEIRTPRILMFFWEGDRIDAHNNFRKFILAHHTPKAEGRPIELPIAASSWFLHNEGREMTEQNQIEFIEKHVKNNLDIDCYWLDAGWYEGEGDWFKSVGTWKAKAKTFPHGLKAVSDKVSEHELGFVLWFEPERARKGTEIYEEHPDFLIIPKNKLTEDQLKTMRPQTADNCLFNMGNPQAREWMTDRISFFIKEYGITVYRQDINIEPIDFWHMADEPDRQGMTEIRYIEGLYQFWDELVERCPGLVIDNCASGGRRIDLETISRSVVLLRSDCFFKPEAMQSQTLGINLYYPCVGVWCDTTDPYIFRSSLSAGMTLMWDVYSEDFDFSEARKRIKEYKILKPLFYGDFHPLTIHSATGVNDIWRTYPSGRSDVWCVYQLERKDLNLGAIFAFRRKGSPYSTATFSLHGLKSNCSYEFTDMDTGCKEIYSGEKLTTEGLEIVMDKSPCSTIKTYHCCPNV